jgi:hypothetical protein
LPCGLAGLGSSLSIGPSNRFAPIQCERLDRRECLFGSQFVSNYVPAYAGGRNKRIDIASQILQPPISAHLAAVRIRVSFELFAFTRDQLFPGGIQQSGFYPRFKIPRHT